SNAVFDFYWYNNDNLIIAGEGKSLTLLSEKTEEGETYTCKVFRPSSSYTPEIFLGSDSVTVKSELNLVPFFDYRKNFWVVKPQCADNIDNDNDGLVDMDDPGCESPDDNDEKNRFYIPFFKLPNFQFFFIPDENNNQCSDGVDNDNDGLVDMDDPGCENPEDDDESNEENSQCSDNIDNDNDGLVDMDDPGCENPEDDDESNEDNNQCSDTTDPGCESPEDDEINEESVLRHKSKSLEEVYLENFQYDVKDDTIDVYGVVVNNGDKEENLEIKIVVGDVEYSVIKKLQKGSSDYFFKTIKKNNAKTLVIQLWDKNGMIDYYQTNITNNFDIDVFYFPEEHKAVKLSWLDRVVIWFKDVWNNLWR
ncbi:hypothetical protein D6777_00050, partial [Candidatus Woesearchaeota archaeon]